MDKQYNYYRIGFFIVIAIIALIALLMALGGSKAFERKIYIETYFGESVQGLQEGSTVKYLGIQIGHVKEIEMLRQAYPQLKGELNGSRYIYVKIAITAPSFENSEFLKTLPKQIKKGLRAQLEPQGLTGTSFLSLTFLPPLQNPLLSINAGKTTIQHALPYIPSATSTITRFTDAINNVFSSLKTNNISGMLTNINTLSATANKAIKAANAAGVSQASRKALLSVASTAHQYQSLAEQLLKLAQKKQVNESIDNIANLTQSLQQTTRLANRTLQGLSKAMHNANQLMMQFKVNEQTLLNNAKEASGNIKIITNNAKDYPSQLLFSKPPPHLDPNTL